MMVKKESEKASLKHNIHKTNIMASRLITSWHIDGGKKWKYRQILFSWVTKLLWMVTAAMKLRLLLLGRKAIASQTVH